MPGGPYSSTRPAQRHPRLQQFTAPSELLGNLSKLALDPTDEHQVREVPIGPADLCERPPSVAIRRRVGQPDDVGCRGYTVSAHQDLAKIPRQRDVGPGLLLSDQGVGRTTKGQLVARSVRTKEILEITTGHGQTLPRDAPLRRLPGEHGAAPFDHAPSVKLPPG